MTDGLRQNLEKWKCVNVCPGRRLDINRAPLSQHVSGKGATRPAGLEPATYGLEIRLWRCKSLLDKHLCRILLLIALGMFSAADRFDYFLVESSFFATHQQQQAEGHHSRHMFCWPSSGYASNAKGSQQD